MKTSLTKLTVPVLSTHPVWRFTNSGADDLEIESAANDVYPDLTGLVIGSQVTLADGSTLWALFQNVSLAGEKVNDHLLTLTVECNGGWIGLARYHDVDCDEYGPPKFAQALGKKNDDVFPIRYDLREVLHLDSPHLQGYVRDKPLVRLTEEQLIALALL